jgi:hypothetical protein
MDFSSFWNLRVNDRLTAWKDFRHYVDGLELKIALEEINQLWSRAPFVNYYLSPDNPKTWPDPWTLLAENYYCDLAKSLGILYTISLLDRADLGSASLVLTRSGHNLVLVEKTKYILNWDSGTIVNTNQDVAIHRLLTQQQIQSNLI